MQVYAKLFNGNGNGNPYKTLTENAQCTYGDDELVDLAMQLPGVLLEGGLLALLDLIEDVLHLPRPPDLVARQTHHALVLHHPPHPAHITHHTCIHASTLHTHLQ